MHALRFGLVILILFFVSLGLSVRRENTLAPTVTPGSDQVPASEATTTKSTPDIGMFQRSPDLVHNLPWPIPDADTWPPPQSFVPPETTRGEPPLDIDRWAELEDPNILSSDFAPRRTEDVSAPIAGPALAVSGLNEVDTINFGLHERFDVPEHKLELRNVGDAALTISRVYSACSCLTRTLDGAEIDPAGWLQPKLVLDPGASTTLRLRLKLDGGDFRAGEPKALYLQIFSDDPQMAAFDPSDPYSHETRLRLVTGLHALERVTPMPGAPFSATPSSEWLDDVQAGAKAVQTDPMTAP